MPKKGKSNKAPVLLIDADVLVYQACAGTEKVIMWDDDICLPVCSLADAYAAFEFKLHWLMDTLESNEVILCFSDDHGRNFRKGVFPDYKSNRIGKPKPTALKFLKEKIINEEYYPTLMMPMLEADDVMGIIATDPTYLQGRKKIIVTIDKDLKSVPCHYFNIGHPDDGVREVTEAEADAWFMMQTLTGDTTDGYSGCPKFGPATAQKALKDVDKTIDAMWPVVVEAYEKAGLGKEYALTMARLARILRDDDYNQETRKVKLWEAPTM